MKSLVYIEVDVDYCSLTYGTAPCTAAIPTTGAIKCFNTISTCQDRANFANAPETFRFSMHGRSYEPIDIDSIPCITSVAFTPGTISLGENLGQRSSLTVSFRDFRHSDTAPAADKYLADRDYDPYTQGTFFGKFRTRQRFIQGRPLRWYQGYEGQSLSEMTERHFVIESMSGPSADGTFTIIAKDILKLADNDRAQAPVASTGRLLNSITNVATSATLTPTGIGNAEYPASGWVCIAGKEVCSFTRSGDTLTLTRGVLGTTAIAHSAAERVQLCYIQTSVAPHLIIADLLINYAGIDASYIDYLTTWATEVTTYLGQVYSIVVTEPTGVNKLVSELIEQAALVMWCDDVNQKVRLQVLRGVSTSSQALTMDNTVEGSFRVEEQPDKRVSQVWTYFDRRDPTQPLDDEDNYRSIAATIAAQSETDYGASKIKKIYSRWIPAGGRAIALRLNDIILARFKDPPRLIELDVFRDTVDVALGGGYVVQSWALQDATGAAESVPAQVTRLRPNEAGAKLSLEEVIFDYEESGADPNARVVTIDTNSFDVNLQILHDSLYAPITTVGSITLTCIIETGIIVGASDATRPAFTVGSFTSGLPINIIVRGRIQGAGGVGGACSTTAGVNGGPGQDGGLALYTRQAITLTLNDGAGEVWGGGGGSGGSKGTSPRAGGGAGTIGGAGQWAGTNGTATAGGTPGGGGPGLAGSTGILVGSGSAGAGGAAGKAIDGVSYCTIVGTGDRRGAEVN